MEFIVCFEKPVLRMGLQIETISTFLPPLFKPYGLKKANRFTGGRLLKQPQKRNRITEQYGKDG